jgi:hypothetical protein
LENVFGAFEHWLVSNCDLIFRVPLQGYAAREFVKLGLQPGELALFSKEAVCFFKSQSNSSSLALVLQVVKANCWLMELDLSVLLQLNP